MNCLWNKIEQILCKKPKYLKGDFFWKMRRLGGQFTFSQKDIFVEVCRRENGYLNKSIICKTDDNNKYHVQVTVNYTKSVTDIECNSQQEFTTLLNDLVNKNYEPCQGVSFEQVMFNPDPVSVRDQLQNLLLEEQWDTGNLIVRSRKCKMYGILNETEDGTFVCDSCSPLMGDPLSIKIEQFEAEEEDLKGQEDCKENEKEKFLTPDEEESDPTWGADVKEHHQVMVEPEVKKSYTRCLECNLVQKNMCNLKRHFVRKHKWDKQKELEGSIKCFRCEGLVLPSMPEYVSHLLEQHKISRDEFPTLCGVCSNVFFFPSHLHIHQKDEHGIPIPAEQKVDRKTKYKPTKVEEPPEKKLKRKEICDALEEVVGVKSLKIMPMCLECDLTFQYSKGLQDHFKIEHMWDMKNPYESSIECLKCDKLVLKNINEYGVHLMEKHEKKREDFFTNCGLCLQVFFLTSHLKNHRKVVHDLTGVNVIERTGTDTEVHCPYCAKVYFLIGRVISHIEKEHASENFKELELYKNYQAKLPVGKNRPSAQCDVCLKWFARSAMIHHKKLVHTDKTLKCHICHKELRPVSYKKHMRRHEKANNRSCLCSICGSSFVTKEDLANHINLHHWTPHPDQPPMKRTFDCTFCGKKYSKKLTLNHHVARIHTDTCSEICDVCGKKFPNKVGLEMHMVMHSDKRIQCTMCNFSTKHSGTLMTHIRNDHERDIDKKRMRNNMLHCSICTKGYSSELKLKKHMGRHEREKAQCPLCSRGFVHKGNLRLHFKDHHNILIPKGEDWNIEDYARRETAFTNTT